MALSGSVSSSKYNGRYVKLTWTATQSIDGNSSTISWVLKGAGTITESGYTIYRAGGFKVVIDGSTCYSVSTDHRIDLADGTVVASGTKTITHNADGTREFSISIQAGIYYYAVNCRGSGTFTLDNIPRASTISVPTFTLGTAGTITVTRASSSFTHTIKYYWGSAEGTIVTTSSNTSISWTPPISLCSVIPNNSSGVGTMVCDTYNGSTYIGRATINWTGNVPESVKPTISTFSATRVNNSVPSAWGIYVQGKSQCTLTVSASSQYDATITACVIKQGSSVLASTHNVTTPVLQNTGNVTYTATVTDSRGRTATGSVTINVVAYSTPSINSVLSQRCLQNGTLNDDGTYVKTTGSFSFASCSSKNTVTATVKYRQGGTSAWSSAVTFSSGTPVVIAGNASVDNTYDVIYSVSDAFTTVTQTDTVSTAFTTMDFKLGGKGVAIGKVAEKNAFEVGIPTYTTGGLCATGLFGYKDPSQYDIDDCTGGVYWLNGWVVNRLGTMPTSGGFHAIMISVKRTETDTEATNQVCIITQGSSVGHVYVRFRDDATSDWSSWI